MNKSTQEEIVSIISKLGKTNTVDILNALAQKRSRQWVSTLLNQLERQGTIARSKIGKNVYYALPDRLDLLGKRVVKRLVNKDLDEDLVFENLKNESPFISGFNEDIRSILHYAFTEMLNNAIEHSESQKIEVLIEEIDNKIAFEVRDHGIGV